MPEKVKMRIFIFLKIKMHPRKELVKSIRIFNSFRNSDIDITKKGSFWLNPKFIT